MKLSKCSFLTILMIVAAGYCFSQDYKKSLSAKTLGTLEGTPVASISGGRVVINSKALNTKSPGGQKLSKVNVSFDKKMRQYVLRRSYRTSNGYYTNLILLKETNRKLFVNLGISQVMYDCFSTQCQSCEEVFIGPTGTIACECPGNESGDCEKTDHCPTDAEYLAALFN